MDPMSGMYRACAGVCNGCDEGTSGIMINGNVDSKYGNGATVDSF